MIEVTVKPESNEPAEPEGNKIQSENPIGHLSIAKRFNIDTPNNEENKKLMEIYEHVKSLSKTGDIDDIIWQVVHLEGVLGAPRLGESRLDRLYRYAKLKRQERQIQEELKNVANPVNIYR